jgi:hypothetical protein
MNEKTNATEKNTASCLATGEILIKIIKGIIENEKVDIPENTDFNKIMKLAFAHRISGFVAYACKYYDIPEPTNTKMATEIYKTAARHTAQEHEIKELSEDFTKAEIEHCFLKGLKVSSLYDIPEMRFMLDIDVYINAENYDNAIEVMKARGYEVGCADEKDCSLSKKPFLNVDLHKELKYDYDLGYEFYENVNERLISLENSCEKKMSNEELYVYLLSHTAHHFATAGTGIKSVIDHYYILKNLLPECDGQILLEYLNKSGLKGFNETFTKLTKFWFMNGEVDETIKEMSDYVILSGAYGTDINFFVNSVLRISDNKKSYFLERLFPDRETLSYRYPVLKKHKALLPVFWGVRIVSTVFDLDRIKSEATGVANVEADVKEKQDSFLKNVGL